MRWRPGAGTTNRSVRAWCGVLVTAALLLVTVWWNVWEVRRTWDHVGAALVTPTPGSVRIVSCDAGSASKGDRTCHGPFTSDDGTVRIDSISLRVPVEAGPGSTASAVVSGTGAGGAWSNDWGFAVGRLGVHVVAGTAGSPPPYPAAGSRAWARRDQPTASITSSLTSKFA
ncbi:hypothetical protein [Micromonospora sp. NPDC023633]|uniref:hypothetical protein n=1 Tax=Micromonospora sp. NPDC023633 TaxID=3154320 RepID=UPI0034049FA8